MTNPTPVIFIHGLWLHASSWQPWTDLFAREGYQPLAPGWPGDSATVAESRENPESIADYGVDDVVDHYAAIIADLPAAPILVGHSFGGMIAQKLLGQDLAAAAVAIDAAQIKGVLPVPLSALRATLPVFKNPANTHKAVTLTAEQFRYAFGNALSEEESDTLYQRWTIPAPGRPLFEAATANFNPHASTKVDTRNSSPWPAAADQRRQGPHRAGERGPGHAGAVPAFRGGDRHRRLPGPGSLADHRQRLASGRDHRARLAATAVAVAAAMDLRSVRQDRRRHRRQPGHRPRRHPRADRRRRTRRRRGPGKLR